MEHRSKKGKQSTVMIKIRIHFFLMLKKIFQHIFSTIVYISCSISSGNQLGRANMIGWGRGMFCQPRTYGRGAGIPLTHVPCCTVIGFPWQAFQGLIHLAMEPDWPNVLPDRAGIKLQHQPLISVPVTCFQGIDTCLN